MGLYDDRLADLSEPRRGRRVAWRQPSAERHRYPTPPHRSTAPAAVPETRPSTSVQSLLFDRDAGWTAGKAKAWARSHGYRYGKLDITDQYIRIRQFDPKGFKVKRTVPFGRGIRAIVAREESMATTTREARSRRPRKKAAKRSGRRRARATARRSSAAKPARRRARKARKVEARRTRRAATRRRRPRRSSHVMEASKPRRRRRRARPALEAWRGDPEGHAKAAKKGWRRRKKSARRGRRRAREAVSEAPRRRRRRSTREASRHVMEARRPRRRYQRRRLGMFEARRGQRGMQAAEIAVALLSGGIGFVVADGLDRLLATYDPAAAEKPKDKFTSDGAGTLANTLNVASRPGFLRIATGIGITALPAVGAVFAEGPLMRSSLEGMAVGAGVNLFKTLWNNLLMPLLIGKDTSASALQKSYIARLYPAEVAAHINMKQTPPLTSVSSAGSGALSGAPAPQPAAGVGAPDVGPFALSGDSPYPTADQALRAGVHGDSPYPNVEQALRAGVHGDSPYPTTAQALRGDQAGMGAPVQPSVAWEPGPPPGPGPGPQAAPHSDPSCGCVGDQYASFLGDAEEKDTLFSG